MKWYRLLTIKILAPNSAMLFSVAGFEVGSWINFRTCDRFILTLSTSTRVWMLEKTGRSIPAKQVMTKTKPAWLQENFDNPLTILIFSTPKTTYFTFAKSSSAWNKGKTKSHDDRWHKWVSTVGQVYLMDRSIRIRHALFLFFPLTRVSFLSSPRLSCPRQNAANVPPLLVSFKSKRPKRSTFKPQYDPK